MSATDVAKHAEELGQKLDMQGNKCYYTGIELIPGLNASIDHVKPVSLYPESKADVSNLVWCDKSINDMKYNFELEHFLKICAAVTNTTKLK